MDIIDTRSHLRLKPHCIQSIEQLQVGTTGLERDDIGIHRIDIPDDIPELTVTHMCMYLSLWLHLRMHQSEGRYSPVQIIAVPTALAQGQFLTKSRLVDLDDPDAVAFEVEHFVADGQSYL